MTRPGNVIPSISIVVAAYNMSRELPRTIFSLSPCMQRGKIDPSSYEVIVVDNGSELPVDPGPWDKWGIQARVIRIDTHEARRSPVGALNRGIQDARGYLVGVMIDGARIASPGILAGVAQAAQLAPRFIAVTLGFHLGPKVQSESVLEGYDTDAEDTLLAESGWTDDGYRLFSISTFSVSSRNGWFRPISESNALFMPRELWSELGGFDEGFQSPGGGFANLDLLSRAVNLPKVTVVTLLGEGTFHQVHGGVATNRSNDDLMAAFNAEYRGLRGRPYRAPEYESVYVGSVPEMPGTQPTNRTPDPVGFRAEPARHHRLRNAISRRVRSVWRR